MEYLNGIKQLNNYHKRQELMFLVFCKKYADSLVKIN